MYLIRENNGKKKHGEEPEKLYEKVKNWAYEYKKNKIEKTILPSKVYDEVSKMAKNLIMAYTVNNKDNENYELAKQTLIMRLTDVDGCYKLSLEDAEKVTEEIMNKWIERLFGNSR